MGPATDKQPNVIETVGEAVEEPTQKSTPIDRKDIPIYTIAGTIDWMKRPENEQKIREMSRIAGETQREIVKGIDREVTKTWRLLVDVATDENVKEDFINKFLGSLIDD